MSDINLLRATSNEARDMTVSDLTGWIDGNGGNISSHLVMLKPNQLDELLDVVDATAWLMKDLCDDHKPLDQGGAIVCSVCGDWWSVCPVNLATQAINTLKVTD